MKIKNLIIAIISLAIIGCGSSGYSAVSTADNTPQPIKDEVLFIETFDSLPDWTTDEVYSSKDYTKVPINWTGSYAAPLWSPAKGFNDKHPTGEILSKNSNMAYGKKGKSYVNWRENSRDGYWNSDSVLIKRFDKDYQSIYFEFEIMFSEELTKTYDDGHLGYSKIARVYHGHYEKKSQMFEYHAGIQNPHLIWDLYGVPANKNGYGIRNELAFLTRRKLGENPQPFPEGPLSSTTHSASYISSTRGTMPGGKDPKLVNKLTGGNLHDEKVADFREVFGNGGTWTKMAFYVKMNSAPGVHDGIFAQWLDGQRIYFRDDVAWISKDRDMVGWNTVGIGGNDYGVTKDPALKYEDWYSIDNLIIRTNPPIGLSLEK